MASQYVVRNVTEGDIATADGVFIYCVGFETRSSFIIKEIRPGRMHLAVVYGSGRTLSFEDNLAFAKKEGFRLVEDGAPFSGLVDDLLKHLAQIGMLLVEIVHVVLEVVREPRKLVEQIMYAHFSVLRAGVGAEAMDLFSPIVDVSNEEFDPRHGLVTSLADVLDLLLC